MISRAEAQKYADVYFDKVHPIYCFVDRVQFEQNVNKRWLGSPSDEFDAVICGVVALGSLFSGADTLSKENDLVELAKAVLEAWNPIQMNLTSSLEGAMAYALRVLYIRFTMDPHSAWIASRAAIAALYGDIEGSVEGSDVILRCPGYDACGSTTERKLHSRLHWAAMILHTWICNDYGPSQEGQYIIEIPCPAPVASGSNDHLPSLISIYHISLRLCNVVRPHTLEDLISILDSLNTLPDMSIHDVLQIHKFCVALLIYRFMRETSSVISQSTLSLVIRLGRPGLATAMRLAEDSQPWWQAIHMPFQVICALLSMDTSESLAEIEGAMNTLRAIERTFIGRTENMRKVIGIAEALLRMCQKGKEEAAAILAQSYQSYDSTNFTTTEDTGTNTDEEEMTMSVTPAGEDFGITEFDLEVFDWDSFLS